jgi:hypothetical protein
LVVPDFVVDGKDILDGLQDGLGDKPSDVGTVFNPPTKQGVASFGVESSIA